MYSLYTKWKRMSSLAARALSVGSDLVPRPDQVAAMRVFVDVVEDGVVAEERRRRQIEVVAAGARLLCRGDGFVHPADVALVGVDDRPAHPRAVAGHDEVHGQLLELAQGADPDVLAVALGEIGQRPLERVAGEEEACAGEGDDERVLAVPGRVDEMHLSLIHISEPTRLGMISYAVFCLKKK